MPTITLKNVPEDLHRRLTARAARHDRPLNQEVIACLEKFTLADEQPTRSFDKEAFLAELHSSRAERRADGPVIDDEWIRDAIDRDRDEMGEIA